VWAGPGLGAFLIIPLLYPSPVLGTFERVTRYSYEAQRREPLYESTTIRSRSLAGNSNDRALHGKSAVNWCAVCLY
jgi:hypothetical protein